MFGSLEISISLDKREVVLDLRIQTVPTTWLAAMLIFYEQNNLYAFKQIFVDQFEFAV